MGKQQVEISPPGKGKERETAVCCGPDVVHRELQVNGDMGGRRWLMGTHLHREHTGLCQFVPD